MTGYDYDGWKTMQPEWQCPSCETVYTGCTGPDADDPQGECPACRSWRCAPWGADDE